MKTAATYVIDADVFISAKNQYYAFEICPGFWASLNYQHEAGNVCSIDKVKGELLAGRETEDLVRWVKGELPAEFFIATNEEEVTSAYTEVMLWVQRNPQYFDRAKAKFATEADGWLVAHAMTSGATVVTNEQPRPESRNRVLLPDVCAQFEVVYEDTFFMLKDLGIKFDWTAPNH